MPGLILYSIYSNTHSITSVRNRIRSSPSYIFKFRVGMATELLHNLVNETCLAQHRFKSRDILVTEYLGKAVVMDPNNLNH